MSAKLWEVPCERCWCGMTCSPGDAIAVIFNKRTRVFKGFFCSPCSKAIAKLVDEIPDWELAVKAFPDEASDA